MLRFALLWILKWELLVSPRCELNCPFPPSCLWGFLLVALMSLHCFAGWFCPAAVRWEMPAPGEGLVPHSCQHSWSPQQSVLAANGREVEGNDTLSWGWGCQLSGFLPEGTQYMWFCSFFSQWYLSVYHCSICKQWVLRYFLSAVFSCIVTSFLSLTGWNQMEHDYVWLFESPLSCNFFYVAKL